MAAVFPQVRVGSRARRVRAAMGSSRLPSGSRAVVLGGYHTLRISGAGLLRNDGQRMLGAGIYCFLHGGAERLVHSFLCPAY
jgi:hypothetical protein